jgi:hypothetical protein
MSLKKFYIKIEDVRGFNWSTKIFQNEMNEPSCILEFQGQSDSKNNDINVYADCILQTLDFIEADSDLVIFSKNVFVTNTISYWMKEVSDTHDSWLKLKQVLDLKNIKVSAFTEY